MTKAPSLVARVTAFLALAQLPAFLITWLLVDGLNFLARNDAKAHIENWNTMAVDRTTELVGASLVKNPDGFIRIEPTPALRAEMRRAPGLQFAAYDPLKWTPISGSSEKLTSRLSALARSKPTHTHFMMNDETSNDVSIARYDGHFSLTPTPLGIVPIAVYGYKFRWIDLFQFYPMDWDFLFVGIFTAVVMTTATAWFAIRRGLRPLAFVAKEVEHIEIDSLNQRLSTSDVPREIRGLVDVVNEALKRLESGANRQRRFAGNAAHELRTPIAILRAQLECQKPSSGRNELLKTTSRLQSIVEQMLISARLAEGQVSLDQRVDLAATVRTLICELLPLALDCGRSLEFEDADLPLVARGNQRAIECVVTNLIDNALREEPEGGVVGLRVEANGIIAVIDHGKGVAPADRNRIFERFWRKSDSDSGSGLGLAIAKDIMDAHGGRIWVEETPGGGATFKLSFPPAHPSKAKFSTPIQSGRSHENRRSFRRGDRR